MSYPHRFFAPDTLETVADAERFASTSVMPMTHDGRPFEAIGRTLRRMDAPEAFSREFLEQLAASVAEEPAFFGRLFHHAIRVAEEAGDA